MARTAPQSAPDEGKGEGTQDKSGAPDEGKGEGAPRPKTGSVRVRTEHPKRFNHVACYGLTFGPEPKTFAPGELPGDALERLKLDPLLVVEEV